MSPGPDCQFAFRQVFPETACHRAKENLIERVLVQIPNVAGSVIILAITGDGQIAINREIVLRFPGESPTGEALAFEPGRPFQVQLETLANYIAEDRKS